MKKLIVYLRNENVKNERLLFYFPHTAQQVIQAVLREHASFKVGRQQPLFIQFIVVEPVAA